jgi:hypothetical protein
VRLTSGWAFATVFVGDINLDRFQRWLWSTPPPEQHKMLQDNPALSAEVEALSVLYQRYVDMQHEIIALRHEMLTLPALPDEGY